MYVSVKKTLACFTLHYIPDSWHFSLHYTDFPTMFSPLHPSPTHCNHSSILSQTLPGIPSPSIPTVHPRATHCFIAQCCSLKEWNSPLHGVKSNQICGVKGGEREGCGERYVLLQVLWFWNCYTLL